MGFLTTEVVLESNSYIFDGAGGKRDQLEQTILQELDKKQYPLKVAIENVKSGVLFMGTKEQCVTIEVAKRKRVVISNTTVGTYLYVTIYLLKKIPTTGAEAMISASTEVVEDIFAYQQTRAVYAAAVAATESAFQVLELKQTNSGYSSKPAN